MQHRSPFVYPAPVDRSRRKHPTASLRFAPRSERDSAGPPFGLLLLYAPDFAALDPVYPLHGEGLLIGADPECQIVLPDAAVSGSHALLAVNGDHVEIADLQSYNGTVVDGERVESARLLPGAEIRLGSVLFKLIRGELAEYGRYRIDGARFGESEEDARCRGARTLLIGGYRMHRVVQLIDDVAASPCSVTVLGETGTGKELAARSLHNASGRNGPFRAHNCATIPAHMMEGQLFGWRRGAFTGAERDHLGLVRAADGGTLFLDEIGELSPEAQAKLLRVVEEKRVLPLGAKDSEAVDVRIVCATHRDLAALAANGAFREDLRARLKDVVIRLPPLRERKEDLHWLVRVFLARHGRPGQRFSTPAMLALLHYDFPHNVRELEAIVRVAAHRCREDEVPFALLPEEVRAGVEEVAPRERRSSGQAATAVARAIDAAPTTLGSPQGGSSPEVGGPSRETLSALLSQHGGNVSAVARSLGVPRGTAYHWLRRHGLSGEAFRMGRG
jgi:DNA-binding NtrC family response regulator